MLLQAERHRDSHATSCRLLLQILKKLTSQVLESVVDCLGNRLLKLSATQLTSARATSPLCKGLTASLLEWSARR